MGSLHMLVIYGLGFVAELIYTCSGMCFYVKVIGLEMGGLVILQVHIYVVELILGC